MAQSIKVPEEEFKSAMRALLNTPPTPASKILKPKNSGKKKH